MVTTRCKQSLLATGALLGLLLAQPVRSEDWPQWLGPKRDSVWREQGILERFPAGGPPIRWRAKTGAGYSGPAVANGRVYLMDRHLAKPGTQPSNPFAQGSIPGTERVLCLNEADGTVLWEHSYDCAYTMSYAAGPRATPLVFGGKAYTLGGEGDLLCLDADTGQAIWSHSFNQEFNTKTPTWGYAASPILYGDKVICLAGGTGSLAVAFQKDTGKEVWRALTAKEPGYAPPTLIELAGKRQLIIWDPEAVNCLNPDTGAVFWQQPFASQTGLSISTPRALGDDLFLTTFYNGSLMLKLNPSGTAATVLWKSKKVSERNTDGLHSIISTPFLEGGYIYGVDSYGQLRCLKAETGDRLWESLQATTNDGKETRWANAFLVKNGDRFFLFNEKGDLIIAKLSPTGYDEISRAHLLDPTNHDPGRDVLWSHPAFANRCVFVRNDQEIVCADLSAEHHRTRHTIR